MFPYKHIVLSRAEPIKARRSQRSRPGRRKCCCRLPARSRRRSPQPRRRRPSRSPSRPNIRGTRAGAVAAQPSSRLRRNANPFGMNSLATTRALLSQLSSAIFWASMTSPIGSSPSVRKHRPTFGRPFCVDFADVRHGARIDPVLVGGVARLPGHDTARFERVADDLDQAKVRAIAPVMRAESSAI